MLYSSYPLHYSLLMDNHSTHIKIQFMLIKNQDACIPEKQEIEQILKDCLYRIKDVGAEIRAINFTIHCLLRPSPHDVLTIGKKLLYDDTELDAPIPNTITFIIRS